KIMFKTPFILPLIYPSLTWKVNTNEKVIYLTFDDGPIPEVTEFVLKQLAVYNAKATFFCIGENVRRYPNIFEKVMNSEHSIGNHTFNHLNGWKTDNEVYLQNAALCQSELEKHGVSTNLFRPPYGRIKFSQISEMTDHKLIMWDVLTKDYNQTVAKEKVLNKTLKYTEAGSIIVMHDSLKAFSSMRYALPIVLEEFSNRGYRFDKL
ncbi:MAG: peptidoglycan/xylan/chitin deacetylase (PgdA/CDA1 family), partial [Spirosomataceae bacterium]